MQITYIDRASGLQEADRCEVARWNQYQLQREWMALTMTHCVGSPLLSPSLLPLSLSPSVAVMCMTASRLNKFYSWRTFKKCISWVSPLSPLFFRQPQHEYDSFGPASGPVNDSVDGQFCAIALHMVRRCASDSYTHTSTTPPQTHQASAW